MSKAFVIKQAWDLGRETLDSLQNRAVRSPYFPRKKQFGSGVRTVISLQHRRQTPLIRLATSSTLKAWSPAFECRHLFGNARRVDSSVTGAKSDAETRRSNAPRVTLRPWDRFNSTLRPAAMAYCEREDTANSNLGRKARGDYFRQWWASRGLSWSLKSFSYKTVSILSLQGGNEVIGGNW